MHFPRWFRYLWWVLLLSGVGGLIYTRWNVISTGQPQVFDTVLLAAAVALVFIPFFTEISLLGFTIKQRAEENKAESKTENGANAATSVATAQSQEPVAVEPIDKSDDQIRKVEVASEDGLFSAMWTAITDGELQRGEEFFKKLQDSEIDAIQKLRNEAVYHYLRYTNGDETALDQLVELSKRTENAPAALTTVLWFLGAAYETSNNFHKATTAYYQAIPKCETKKGAAQFFVSIAKCLYRMGEKQAAYNSLLKQVEDDNDSESLFVIYEGLAELYKYDDLWELRAIALEKGLTEKPNDIGARFAAAYAYSEAGLTNLSILHYSSLIKLQPKYNVALNNIAVEYSRVNLPITATSYYKRAVALNYTLAAANLAFQYLNAGFAEDARRVLDDARKQQEVHANVGSAITSLSTKEEEEIKAKEEIIETARAQQLFMTQYADALFCQSTVTANVAGEWLSQEGLEVTITQNNQQVEMVWLQEGKKHKIDGKITRYSLKGKLHRMSYYQVDKELGYNEIGHSYSTISTDEQEINIIAIEKRKAKRFTVKRKPRDIVE